MSNRPKRTNSRQRDFRVVARGVNRATPDISRLMLTSLEFYLAYQEKSAEAQRILMFGHPENERDRGEDQGGEYDEE